jgi:O-6-methylguanine DNA methyltransferase
MLPDLLSQSTIKTPLGSMVAIASAKGLSVLSFEEEETFFDQKIGCYAQYKFTRSYQQTLKVTEDWLKTYFSKALKLAVMPPIDLQGTDFTVRAWKQLLKVPFGKTATYGALALKMGSPTAARAVGRAMGQNRIAILLPCHRILGSNGTLTGYSAGLRRKQWLLQHEGLG